MISPVPHRPASLSPESRAAETPEKVIEAARQFESLLVEQMLKSMRESEGGGWMGTGEDKAGSSLMEYAEQEMARVIAAGGGFGLARMVAEGLTRPQR